MAKNKGKIRSKINDLKKTSKGRAILKLIGWGVFFAGLFIFCIIASLITPKKVNNDLPPKVDEPLENAIPKVLKTEDVVQMLKKLEVFDYVVEIQDKNLLYTFEGHKNLDNENGYKSSNEIIKYYIDSEGVYQELQGEKVPLAGLYDNLNERFMPWDHLFSFVASLEYNKIEEDNIYHMASLVEDIYLEVNDGLITRIKIEGTDSENLRYSYNYIFKNIGGIS